MSINKFFISNYYCAKIFNAVFKMLNCNLLWIIYSNNNIVVTDECVVDYYLDRKYYLQDPNIIKIKANNNKSSWKITLGTDCDAFNKNGFLHDLHKMFNIEEFVSIEKQIGSKYYCFRFFTKNNRFIFMNNLLNNMPIIKYFIKSIVKSLKGDFSKLATV